MSNIENKTVWRAQRGVENVEMAGNIDLGLRTYLSRVFMYMAMGLLFTGAVAYTVASIPALSQLISGTSLLGLVVLLAPLALVFFISRRIESLSYSTAQGLFWLYAGLMGMSLASLFIDYTGESIARVFFISSSMFGFMSLYGYTTSKDLSGIGSFMIMGLVGIVIAGLINIFLQSSAMQFIISLIAVIVFTGLTAYDTQRIKLMYYEGDAQEVTGKKALIGALTLYLDFLNLFVAMLRLLGDRR